MTPDTAGTRPQAPLQCWKCGHPLGDEPLPLARAAQCVACGAGLHVCRMCEFHDQRVARQCREPIAEEVTDKERPNFCDYLRVRPGTWIAPDRAATDAARASLNALFELGADAPPADGADESLRRLRALFGDGGKS
ncbi:MAG: hypothetical protein AB7Q97_13795 [Gammaproteobacteria bacterium]